MNKFADWYVAAMGAFALLAGSLVLGVTAAEAHDPQTVVVNAVGSLGFQSFPQTHSVTGTVEHHSPGNVDSVHLQLKVNNADHGAEAQVSIGGNASSGPFSLPWLITGPGTYDVAVTARHGNDVVTSTTQQVTVTHLGTIIIEKVSLSAVGAFSFGGDLGAFGITTTVAGTPVAAGSPFVVAAGTYDITETVPVDWGLVVTCLVTGGSSSTWDAAVVSDGVRIGLAGGETVTCTFTNTYTDPTGNSVHPGCNGIDQALDRVRNNPGAAKSQGKGVDALVEVAAKLGCA